jgi:hypothetical protein
MARLTIAGIDDDAYLEAWKSERRREAISTSNSKCAEVRKLINALDDDLRILMNAFWHKGRKVYLMWTLYEIIERTGMSKADVEFNISRLMHLKAGMLEYHFSHAPTRQRTPIYGLTDIGKDVASEERHIFEGSTIRSSPINLVSARKVLRLDVKKMAARLCVESHELIAMEKGMMPISAHIADTVVKELKRPRSFEE